MNFVEAKSCEPPVQSQGIANIRMRSEFMPSCNPVEVYLAKDLPEAQFVKSLLSEARIEATIVGEPLGTVLGDIPGFEAAPRIWVHRPDADRARSIIDEYE